MSFTIALCDDDSEQLSYFRTILSEWASERKIDVRILEYSSAENFLFEYPDNPCNFLLLDIEMKKLNGMEVAKKLRRENDMLPIVFVTGFSEYISEGYDVQALHYLLKPVNKEKLFEVLDRYVRGKNIKTDEIIIRTKDGASHVATSQIVFIEAFGRKTEVTIFNGASFAERCGKIVECIESVDSIGCFEKLLEKQKDFFHCHRSYLVNMRYVKSVGKTSITLDSGKLLPLSRRLYQEVNRKFIEYYKGGLQGTGE